MSQFNETSRILVVDDQTSTRELIVQKLAELGYSTVDTAYDGVNALEVLEKSIGAGQPYAVMFLDWVMPNMQGIDVLKKVKSDPRFSELKIIMLTAELERENVVEAVQGGVTGYLPKPVDKTDLKKILDRIRGVKEAVPERKGFFKKFF